MQVTQPKPKKRAKFRISFIVLFFLASFIICFFTYMRSDSDFMLFDMFSKTEESESAPLSENETDKGETPASGGIVAESEAKDLSYFDNVMFVGAAELSSLSGFAWVKPDRVISDSAINSSNIGSLVVRWNGSNQTPTEAVASVKPSALYIMLRPEDSLSTETLKAFTDSASTDGAKIYIISSFPPAENSETTVTETDSFNAALLKFAQENSLKYIDINLSLTDNAGRLRSEYVSGNGISGTGAEFFAKFLLSHT